MIKECVQCKSIADKLTSKYNFIRYMYMIKLYGWKIKVALLIYYMYFINYKKSN